MRSMIILSGLLVAVGLTDTGKAWSQTEAQPRGMTWAKAQHLADEGVDVVSCHGGETKCDAHKGDTPCATALPLLCIRASGAPNPGVPSPRNTQWAGGHIATTLPVAGYKLVSPEVADDICSSAHGDGWRMAEFHDGWGWGFRAFGNVRRDTRFWVRIKNQKANCWDQLPKVAAVIYAYSQCSNGVLYVTVFGDEGHGFFESTTVNGTCDGNWVKDAVQIK